MNAQLLYLIIIRASFRIQHTTRNELQLRISNTIKGISIWITKTYN